MTKTSLSLTTSFLLSSLLRIRRQNSLFTTYIPFPNRAGYSRFTFDLARSTRISPVPPPQPQHTLSLLQQHIKYNTATTSKACQCILPSIHIQNKPTCYQSNTMAQARNIVSSNRADRWGYTQDFGIIIDAFDNALPCPANADLLVQAAVARMGRNDLPPQFARFLVDYKADSWLDLVTTTIPQLQAQIQNTPQIQALQAQNVALQTQIIAAQPQTQALQTQIAALQTQLQALQNQNAALNAQNQGHRNELAARENRIEVLENHIADNPAGNMTAEQIAVIVYGPPPAIPAHHPVLEEVQIEVADAQQGHTLLLMESLVNGMAETIRNRVTNGLAGRLRAWLQMADGRKAVAIQAQAQD